MKCFLLFIFIIVHSFAFAQVKNHFKINPGQRVLWTIPNADKFCYTDFMEGTVYMRNDAFAKAKMNYNSLLEEMQFIDPKGDTLSLDNEETFRMIVIATDTFYYDKGYLKQQKKFGDIKLAYHDKFTFVNRQKMGGMGETTSASVDTYNSVSSSTYFKDLVAKEIITLAKERMYFIGDQFNHFKQANRKNILDFFPDREKEIKDYFKENTPDFKSEEYLVALLTHFQSSE